MKNKNYEFDPKAGTRDDGAPIDYARYRANVRDELDATDIMLALRIDEDDEQQSFDPYNSSTP